MASAAAKSALGAVLVGFMLLGSLHTASAIAGDSFLGDITSADLSKFNFGKYVGTKGGYGSVSFIDNGEGISWEVDIFQVPEPPTTLELALATQGLPTVLALSSPDNPPSPDGVSFGLISYSDLEDAIAASANPAASLKDGSLVVVAKFAKPANAAMIASVSDGTTVVAEVQAPPSPPNAAPPAPDMYSLHPGVDPEIFYSQLDGTMVAVLEEGIRQGSNGTATVLMYDWFDGTYTWELELNGVGNPHTLELRVFVDLWNTPTLFELTPNEPWDPATISYTGTINASQITDALEKLGLNDEVGLHDYTPRLFFQLIDDVLSEEGSTSATATDAEAEAADPEAAGEDASSAGGSGKVGVVASKKRRTLLQSMNELGAVVVDNVSGSGTCGATGPTRLIGFVFDTNSRWKLKPVLKDVRDLPSSVKYVPLYVSAGFLGISAIVLIALYIAGVLESA